MFISASEALNLSESTESNISENCLEAMPALINKKSMENFMMSSKRSADSESSEDSLSNSMSLGAGPLWWSWCPWAPQGRSAAIAAYFPHWTPALGCRAQRQDALHRPAAVHAAWRLPWGIRFLAGGCRGEAELPARCRCVPKWSHRPRNAGEDVHVPRLRSVVADITDHPASTSSWKHLHALHHRVVRNESLGTLALPVHTY